MIALCGMAILLIVIAVLQYQWGKQLRAATELQIGSNLQSVMTSWQRDLYDELSAICIALQVGPDSGAHDAWNDYLQRYADWDRDGVSHEVAGGLYANPDLIREIYIWQTSIQPVQLLRLNPQSKGVDIAEVPKEYGDLLREMLRSDRIPHGVALLSLVGNSSPRSQLLSTRFSIIGIPSTTELRSTLKLSIGWLLYWI
jgi:hypothetical protein